MMAGTTCDFRSGSCQTRVALLGPISLSRPAVVAELADGPEQAVRHQIEVTRVFDRRVVVAERGAEDAGLVAVVVGPGDDVVVLLAVLGLLAAGEGSGGLPE